MERLTAHAVADIFPTMTNEEFEGLKADIAANGVREPIYLHDGKIIDGKNRYRACHELKIDCPTRNWNGKGSLVAFVISLNKHRRHLTAGQLAVAAQESLPFFEKEAKERQRTNDGTTRSSKSESQVVAIVPQAEREPKAREQAAAAVGVSARYVQDAKTIKEESPELYEKVRAGEVTIPAAMRELKEGEASEATETQLKPERNPAIRYSTEAINCLMRIPPKDPKRAFGLQRVADWIKSNS